ncbi:MAG TPA: hypothetical protein VMR79_10245 [Verrucomicrobiae bacterium]|nr:hypothetical protein [Verrucomicrobiae bacterium]
MKEGPSAAALALAWAAVVAVFWGGLVVPNMQAGLRRPMDIDLYGYFVPKFWYGNAELAAGRLPLWNPYEYGGLPFLGAAQPAALYPPKIAVYALAGRAATHAYMTLHYLLAGGVAFVALRGLGLGWPGAALGTITWTFSPLNMESHYHLNRLACLAWVPLVFLAFVRVLERPGPRAAAVLAGAAALTLLAGYPEYALDTGLCLLVFSLVAAPRLEPQGRRALGWLAASGLLAAALVALQVVALLEMAGESVRAGRIPPAVTVPHLAALATFADPRLLGVLVRSVGQGFHLAPLAWLLAVVGALAGRARFRLAFAVLWVMAVALGSVLNGPLHLLPIFSRLRGSYCWVGLSYLPAAYLAGAGLDAMLARPADVPRRRTVLAGGIWLASALWVGARSWPWLALGLGLLAVARASAAWRTPAVLALVASVTWALWAWNPPSFTRPLPHRFARGEPPYPPEPPRVTGLAAEVGRDCGPAPTRVAAPWLIWGGEAVTERVELVQGYPESIAPGRMQRLLGELGLDPERGLPDWERVATRGRLLDLLNVGCVLAPRIVRLDAERLELAPAGGVGATVIYRRAHPLPRAFLVHRALAVADPDAAWQALVRPGFDPAQEAIVEGAIPAALADGSGTVQVKERAPGELVLDVSASSSALLVVAESWFPGWRARVDGQEAPLARADYVAMALPIAAGEHRVVLSYGSRAVHAAAALSALALVATVALFLRRGR